MDESPFHQEAKTEAVEEPFTLYGLWENDAIVGEVGPPQFPTTSQAAATMTHLSEYDIESIAREASGLGHYLEVDEVEEGVASPLEFL